MKNRPNSTAANCGEMKKSGWTSEKKSVWNRAEINCQQSSFGFYEEDAIFLRGEKEVKKDLKFLKICTFFFWLFFFK